MVGSDAELVASAVPFVKKGLRAGDITVLSASPPTAELIARELGEQVASVENDPRISLLGVRAPDALQLTRRLVDRAATTGSGWVRVLGEVSFGSAPRNWREGQRYEAAANRLLAGRPLAAMCLYDTRVLAPEVVGSAGMTHPELVVGGRRVPSPDFRDAAEYLRSLPVPREPVEDTVPVFAVEDAPTLTGLRHDLAAVLGARVRDRERWQDLHLAVSEVAANAFRHGRPPVSARVWADTERIVCTITDAGRGFDDPLAGLQPAHGDDLARGGMGLWLARKLWDHVDLMPGPAGLTVRLSSGLA